MYDAAGGVDVVTAARAGCQLRDLGVLADVDPGPGRRLGQAMHELADVDARRPAGPPCRRRRSRCRSRCEVSACRRRSPGSRPDRRASAGSCASGRPAWRSWPGSACRSAGSRSRWSVPCTSSSMVSMARLYSRNISSASGWPYRLMALPKPMARAGGGHPAVAAGGAPAHGVVSRTTTLAPCRAASRAADRPVKPAPTMAMSAFSGTGVAAVVTGRCRGVEPIGGELHRCLLSSRGSEPEERVELVEGLHGGVVVALGNGVIATVEQHQVPEAHVVHRIRS